MFYSVHKNLENNKNLLSNLRTSSNRTQQDLINYGKERSINIWQAFVKPEILYNPTLNNIFKIIV